MRKYIFLLLMGISQLTFAQFWQDSTLSSQAIKEDFLSLKSNIYSTHQDAFFYGDSLEFELKLIQLQDYFATGASKSEFLLEVGSLLQYFQDSHTYLNYQHLIGELKKGEGRALPFRIKLINSDVYLSVDRLQLIPPGAKLISINGEQFTSLLAGMHSLSIIEGDAKNGYLSIAESIFPTLAHHIVDLNTTNTIEYLAYGESTPQTIDYPALKIDELKDLLGKGAKKNPVSLEIDSMNVAILKITSFSRGSDPKYWRSIQKAFAKMKRAECRRLIIDLRGNTGGSSERMESLFPYLELQPSNVPSNIIARQSLLSMERNDQTFKGFSKWMLTHFFKKNEDVQNYLQMVRLKPGETDTIYYTEKLEPQRHRFTGDVFLLIDGLTGSASVNFASKFIQNEIGTVVGEPCLGPLGGTWGNPASFTLPNSRISVNVSTIRFNTNNDFSKSSIQITPHREIGPSIKDLAEERDGPLEWVIERVNLDLKEED